MSERREYVPSAPRWVGHVMPGAEDTAPEGEYLVGLVVVPERRRLGVGEALVRAAAAYAAERAEVLWSTYDEDNLASAHLHASLGFARSGAAT